jgi:hypothetical protein
MPLAPQIHNARADGGEGSGGGGGAPAAGVAKVALLFLTKGGLPAEPVWQLFLDSASAAAKKRGGNWQQLFSVIIHPPPGQTPPGLGSLAGHALPDSERAAVQWGDHSMVSRPAGGAAASQPGLAWALLKLCRASGPPAVAGMQHCRVYGRLPHAHAMQACPMSSRLLPVPALLPADRC